MAILINLVKSNFVVTCQTSLDKRQYLVDAPWLQHTSVTSIMIIIHVTFKLYFNSFSLGDQHKDRRAVAIVMATTIQHTIGLYH